MKVRYVFKHNKTGVIEFRYATLEEIENGILFQFKKELESFGYELISRDQYIGMLDVNNKEIYENDMFYSRYKVSYACKSEDDGAALGLELGWYYERGDFESYDIIKFTDRKNCNDTNHDIYLITGNIYETIKEE